ncbi:MAG: hypothetical protein RIQ93_1149 [Verrucomicrobiota bacterium]|jgi:penicillin-binding protein 2
MPQNDSNLADRSGGLVESHKGYDPRLIFFYFVLFAMLATLVSGLAYQQLSRVGHYSERERVQNQRRILVPGPRGNIYDRNGVALVVNQPRWTAVLHLDELKKELALEDRRIRRNYVAAGEKKDALSAAQFQKLARASVAQRYLDQVNRIVHRELVVDRAALEKHFSRELLLPFTLVDDLNDHDYARLIEGLPVNSALQVYASFTRHYPFRSAAAHTLGYVRTEAEVEAEGFPGEDLTTFKMKGTQGRAGLEQWFDSELQGEAGGRIYRVDPSGYKINPPLEQRLPKQGKGLITSLDIELQQIAEEGLGEQRGAVVALDVATGEVLVLASAPTYDLNNWYPRMAPDTYQTIQASGAEFNNAVSGRYPPGSTFKILTTIAALRRGTVDVNQPIINCDGILRRAGGRFVCYNGIGHHQQVLLPQAVAESCDIFFYEAGWLTGAAEIAAEGRRFRLNEKTGLESPNDSSARLIVPDPVWKEKERREKWFPGDTANMAIGQGFVLLSPLQMACFTASVARGEVFTRPTLVHQKDRPVQRTESIGLTAEQREALLDGMVGCTLPPKGTARTLTEVVGYRIPGVKIAGKTGTAQKDVTKDGKQGKINFAWFICFAPADKPEIAVAVMVEGENLNEEFGGGRQSAPIAASVMKKYFENKANPRRAFVSPFNKGSE